MHSPLILPPGEPPRRRPEPLEFDFDAKPEPTLEPLFHPVLEAALEYAAAGYRILPLRGKTPLIRRWPQRATTDAETIYAWFETWPEANIGIATGQGLAVIDVDPKHGGQADPAWPATRTALTPSGGQHHYYHVDAEVRNSGGALGQGVDVRGDGGYVVAPPSPGYAWASARPVAVVGPELFRAAGLLGREAGPPPGWEPFKPRESVGPGERNDYLTRLAGKILQLGFDVDAMAETLREHNQQVCVPPLEERELVTIIQSASRWAS